MAMGIHTSMKCREKRAKYLLLLTKLLYNFKVLFFRIIISLEDILLPWMVWTLGCFFRVTPEQADGIWAMEKHLENSSPSYTPGICVEETFWFQSWLSSEEKGKRYIPRKEMQPTLGNAWLSVRSSVHGESSRLAEFSVPWKTHSTTFWV